MCPDVLTDWPNGGVIGLHGTDEPGSSRAARRTAIRLSNSDIERLYALTPVGTPLTIH